MNAKSSPAGKQVSPASTLSSLLAHGCLLALLATWFPGTLQAADSTSSDRNALDQLLKVRSLGQGNVEAVAAWKTVSQQPASSIPSLLEAMDEAHDIAANYLRSAIETIAQRTAAEQKPLPIADLGRFVFDLRHSPRARKLAFDLLSEQVPSARPRLLSGMLNDPSVELRYDAVQWLIQQATNTAAASPQEALLLYQQAVSCARHVDQIEFLSAQLKKAGHPVNLEKLFGWVQKWKVVGPFDNTGRSGFDKTYGPENGPVQLSAEYDGKSGKVRWVDFQGKDEYGKIDVNKPLGALKETIAYCYTELESDKAQVVELRLGCKNAWKIWVNDKFLFGRDEYHRGAEIDQYRLKAELKPGRNTVLVKLGQNEQKEEWTVEWEFQLRVTDGLGTPIVLQPSPSFSRDTAQR